MSSGMIAAIAVLAIIGFLVFYIVNDGNIQYGYQKYTNRGALVGLLIGLFGLAVQDGQLNIWPVFIWPCLGALAGGIYSYFHMQYVNEIIARAGVSQDDLSHRDIEYENAPDTFAGAQAGEGFDFDASAFESAASSEKGSSSKTVTTSQSDKPAPRGFETRHPDDAKLWAVVDDSAASATERVTAMQKIAKREEKRKGETSRAVGKRNA